jgi:hypothetical protein
VATNVEIVWDDIALKLWSTRSPSVASAMDRVAAAIVLAEKRHAPVSKVQKVYASKGAVVKGGRRHLGDFPLRPSGYLRSSIHAMRQPDGDILIGPTAPYSAYVVFGTPPHDIHSTGPWPLRNRATGQVFGQVVHHPGTAPNNFPQRALDDVKGLIIRVS